MGLQLRRVWMSSNWLRTSSHGISGSNSVTQLGKSSPTRIRGEDPCWDPATLRVSGRCQGQDQRLPELDAHWRVHPSEPTKELAQPSSLISSLPCGSNNCLPVTNLTGTDQNIPMTRRNRRTGSLLDGLCNNIVGTKFVSLCMRGFPWRCAWRSGTHTQEMGTRIRRPRHPMKRKRPQVHDCSRGHPHDKFWDVRKLLDNTCRAHMCGSQENSIMSMLFA